MLSFNLRLFWNARLFFFFKIVPLYKILSNQMLMMAYLTPFLFLMFGIREIEEKFPYTR